MKGPGQMTGSFSVSAMQSTGLAMQRVLAATRAELLELQTVRSVTTVLGRNVITLLALGARQRNARTDICGFCHGSPL